jgi:transposase
MATEEVSMSGKRYTDEFKIEAVKQVTERGHSVADVAQRLGITTHSLYAWKRQLGKPDVVQQTELDQNAEVRRLKAELKRVTEERDILKKAAAYFAKG